MLGFARIDLGLTQEEFWDCTPEEFFSFVRRHEEKLKREDYKDGQLILLIANQNRKRPIKKTPLEIWPWHKKKKGSQREAVNELRENLLAAASASKKRKGVADGN